MTVQFSLHFLRTPTIVAVTNNLVHLLSRVSVPLTMFDIEIETMHKKVYGTNYIGVI